MLYIPRKQEESTRKQDNLCSGAEEKVLPTAELLAATCRVETKEKKKFFIAVTTGTGNTGGFLEPTVLLE